MTMEEDIKKAFEAEREKLKKMKETESEENPIRSIQTRLVRTALAIGALVALILTILFLASVSLGGCVPFDFGGEKKGGGVSGGTVQVPCGTLTTVVVPGLNVMDVWPNGNTYGVNSFYIWELDDASTPEQEELYYHSTGDLVQSWLPSKGWEIPTADWSAIRMNWDGLDPRKFSAEDPFVVFYLPYTQSAISWKSKFGSTNDGTCPENNYMINNRFRCIGKNQLDQRAPSFVEGKTYLLQMGMVVPFVDDNGTETIHVQSCYRATVRW